MAQVCNFWPGGGVHGFCIVVERALRDQTWYERIPRVVKWFFTMAIVFFAWVLFSSGDLSVACQTYRNMFVSMSDHVNFTWQYYLTNRTILFLIIAIAGFIFGIRGIHEKVTGLINTEAGTVIKRGLLLALFVADILYVVNSSYSPFIYFQF